MAFSKDRQQLRWHSFQFRELWVGRCRYGAGDGNRTHAICLGSKSSTIELHPHLVLAVPTESKHPQSAKSHSLLQGGCQSQHLSWNWRSRAAVQHMDHSAHLLWKGGRQRLGGHCDAIIFILIFLSKIDRQGLLNLRLELFI